MQRAEQATKLMCTGGEHAHMPYASTPNTMAESEQKGVLQMVMVTVVMALGAEHCRDC